MGIFLCGETGIVNRGCEAIIRSTVKVLNQRSGDIYLATSAPEMDLPMIKNLGINLIHYNSFPTKYHRYYAAVMRKLGHPVDGRFLQAELFSYLSKNDVCLNIGGDTYCYGRPSRSIELNDFTSKKKINNILWCCSVEESVMHGEILADLKKYRYIFARENITYKNLIKAGINKDRIVKCCDPAFFLEKQAVELPENFAVGNTVGLNVSEMIVSEKYPEAYPSIISLIEEILDKTDMNVCLIPHVYSIEKNICDWLILSKIYEHFNNNRISIVNKSYNCEQLKYIISQCRFMIAARTHASIAAYSSEVPTLVLGYSIKSKGISNDLFGTDVHYVLPNAEITAQRMIEDFRYIVNHEEEIRERLHTFLPEYKKSLSDEIPKILDLIKTDTICDKTLCTGCQACKNVCPKDCISMVADEQGFWYPQIDSRKCISCGKCKQVCPSANRYSDNGKKPECYAAINKDDDVRSRSSSGGVYSEIAKTVVENLGTVFGSAFDDCQEVKIVACHNLLDVNKTMGSKYVQADVQETYKEAKALLEQGKSVLFTGTPCIISGLYAFLKRDYDNLLTVDTICHGVPSPKAWSEYKDSLEKAYKSKIKEVEFRNKETGWQTYSMKIEFENGEILTEKVTHNIYLKSFVSHLIIRPSCYVCPSRQMHRQADITLGDFWGVKNWNAAKNDDKGISVVLIHSDKGKRMLEAIKKRFEIYEISTEAALCDNPTYLHSHQPSPYLKLYQKKWAKAPFPEAAKIFCEQTKSAKKYRQLKLLTNWKWK